METYVSVILATKIGDPPNMETLSSINRVASCGNSITGGFHCWTLTYTPCKPLKTTSLFDINLVTFYKAKTRYDLS